MTKFVMWLLSWWSGNSARLELMRSRASQYGLMALDTARREIGRGEFGGNNSGPDVRRYRQGFGGSGPWCAAFVCWCIEQSSARLSRRVPVKRTHGARRLFRRVCAAGCKVGKDEVEPGDIVLWSRGKKAWQGHVGIVSAVERTREGRVTAWRYIAGNEGRYPAVVNEFAGKEKRLVGFARLPR